ncbi:hypothetical protein DPSP01_001891 [Paraphaeosphaeria sporulosa]|uniref:Uncharacterized protein n=1 Tax=Paraphaeosphaeria sporulosa TaxID=1460663 RepID=A0A177C1W0_9PLEO|nr:uncharacterized protein CC84DRAFT_1262791 [Paraphaeosphaeria sporulosa]OAG01774.1 hypothetical protein CC84DRAFT_1262791 [Paraphaeosphaeria sporulosa]
MQAYHSQCRYLHAEYRDTSTWLVSHSSNVHDLAGRKTYVRIAPHEFGIANIQVYRTIHRIGSDFNESPWYQKQVPPQYTDETCGVLGIFNNKTTCRRRRLFEAGGTRNIVAEWKPQVTELADLTVQRIKADLEAGQGDVMKWWMFLASDVTGGFAFGGPFRNLKNGTKSGLVQDIKAAMPIIGVHTELPWLKPRSRQYSYLGRDYVECAT